MKVFNLIAKARSIRRYKETLLFLIPTHIGVKQTAIGVGKLLFHSADEKRVEGF